MAWVQSETINMHYDYLTSKNLQAEETLIFVHGLGMDMHSWDYLIPFLSDYYHLLIYDLRGHGQSDAGKTDNMAAALRDDLAFLINHFSITRYHIVGHGLGGFPGVKLAAEHYQGLKSLILMSVPLHYPEKLGNQVISGRKDVVSGEQTMITLGEQVKNNAFYEPTDEKRQILLNAFKKVTPTTYFNIFQLDFLTSALENLRQVTVPILVLSGAEDNMFPPELSGAILNFTSTARHYSVPKASFMLQMDQPKLLADWIHDFIKTNDDSRLKTDDEAMYLKQLTSQLYTDIRGFLEVNQDDEAQLSKLHVHIINGFEVYVNDKRLFEGWGKRKAKPLLVYLMFNPSTTRDDLCDHFWPDVDLKQAKNRLRVSLHYMKKLLGDHDDGTSILITEREHVFLHANLQCDLFDYIEAVKQAHQIEFAHERVKVNEQLLHERKENMLPGLFEDWFIRLNEWLENEWVSMAIYNAVWYEKQGEKSMAIARIKLALIYRDANEEWHAWLEQLEEKISTKK